MGNEDICAKLGGLGFITAYREDKVSFQCFTSQWYHLTSAKEEVVDTSTDTSADEDAESDSFVEWQEHPLLVGGPFKFGIIAKRYEGIFEDITLVRPGVNAPLVCEDMIKGLCDALENRTEVNAVVLKFEDYGTISRLFNVLRLFRLRCPAVPIIFASNEFRRDDFGPERLSLCDASIRLPTTTWRLQEALLASQDNNAIWVARCSETQEESVANDELENTPARLTPLQQSFAIPSVVPHYMRRRARRRQVATVHASAP